jgi:glutathione S-transferase
MSLTVFGTSRSRAFRVLWMLEELGLPYEHRPMSWQHCAADRQYVAINPAGTIPCISDDGFVLAESLAINLYLSRKADSLWPASDLLQASALQWSFWAATSLETPYEAWATHTQWLPEHLRERQKADAAAESLQRPLDRLERHLSGRPYLLGEAFTVADLNVAGVMGLLRKLEAERRPSVTAWLTRCIARPAYAAAAMLP